MLCYTFISEHCPAPASLNFFHATTTIHIRAYTHTSTHMHACKQTNKLNPFFCWHFYYNSTSKGQDSSVQQWTCNHRVAGSVPCRNSGRIFFLSVVILTRCLFHPYVSTVSMKDPSHSAKRAGGTLHITIKYQGFILALDISCWTDSSSKCPKFLFCNRHDTQTLFR